MIRWSALISIAQGWAMILLIVLMGGVYGKTLSLGTGPIPDHLIIVMKIGLLTWHFLIPGSLCTVALMCVYFSSLNESKKQVVYWLHGTLWIGVAVGFAYLFSR